MTKLLEIRDVWRGSSVSISDDSWYRRLHPSNRHDLQSEPTIVIVRRGSYRRRFRYQQVIGTPNHVTFYNPGEPYEVDHIRGPQTKVTAIRISFDLLSALLASRDPKAAAENRFPEHVTHTLCPPNWYRLHKELLSYLSTTEVPEELMVEEVLLALLDKIIGQACETECAPTGSGASHSTSLARVAATQEFLADRFAENLTMKDIAKAVGCSPWHLARQFTSHVGLPIHRFLNRLRLRNALEQLCDGEVDLAGLAEESGFCSHSHFSSAFKREFGVTPRQARKADHAAFLREVANQLTNPKPSGEIVYFS